MIAALLGLVLSLDPLAGQLDPFPAGSVADYQIGGAFEPAADVDVVVRDRTDEPAPGRWSVCYVNAFQTQPGELAAWRAEHPDLLLRDADGDLVTDPGWPDEVLLDVGSAARRVELVRVLRPWLRGCAADGYAAVELDNLDVWDRSRGLLQQDDLAEAARLVVAEAHRAGLAVAQKNAAELLDRDLGFDLAVTEECEAYRECDAYVERYGHAVVEVEYTDGGRAAFDRACRERGGKHPISLRDRDVTTPDDPAFVDEHC